MINHQLFELIKQISSQVLGKQAEFSLAEHNPDTLSQADLLALLMKEMAQVLSRTTDEGFRRHLSIDVQHLLKEGEQTAKYQRGVGQVAPRKHYTFEDLAVKITHEFFAKGLMALIEVYENGKLVPAEEVRELVSICLRNHDLLSDLENQQSLALLLDTDSRLSSVLASRLQTRLEEMGFSVVGVFHSFKTGADRYKSFIEALAIAQARLADARVQGQLLFNTGV